MNVKSTGGCKIGVLPITVANSYPLIDLGSAKEEDSNLVEAMIHQNVDG